MNPKMMRFGIACLLMGTAVCWAEPWDDEADTIAFDQQQQTYADTQNDSTQPPTLASLKRQIERQNERIDGLTTLVEGLSASLMELQQKATNPSGVSDNSAEALQKLAVMIDKINADYVSKSELDRRMSGQGAAPVSSPRSVTAPSVQQETSLEGQKPDVLYSEAVRAFGKRRYDDAKKRFVIADAKGYKPAASNYYLGEISYYTQRYDDAIFYYKKSAGLYDKAEYIDVLLLHTAISLEKTGNKDQAKLFYQNIIDNYGSRKTAQIAKENIKRL